MLVTSAGFEPGFRSGGPIRSLVGIVDTISTETELRLVTRDRDVGSVDAYPGLSGHWRPRGRSLVFYLNTRRPGQWLRLWRQLRATKFHMLYVNSLWNPTFTVVPVLAVRIGLIRAHTTLLAPSGELAPGALSLKSGKKRLFLMFWGPLLKTMNVVYQASSELEATQIRATMPWARVEVCPDQVSLPEEPLLPISSTESRARLVFIGRISPMKNVDLILNALKVVVTAVDLDIFGPLEDARYWAKCKALMNRLPEHIHVQYRGELAPAEVRTTFSAYDALVLPTLGENFGHAIVESLSASCSVLCSDMTQWTHLLERGGGIVVRDLTVAGLAKELERFAAMTPSSRLQARRAAGDAYRSWRRDAGGLNVLDRARLAKW